MDAQDAQDFFRKRLAFIAGALQETFAFNPVHPQIRTSSYHDPLLFGTLSFSCSGNAFVDLPPTQPLADSQASCALRRSSLIFCPSWTSSSPYPTLGGTLSSLLQPLSGPSPFFVALRGNVFTFCPSWTSSSPFPTFGRSLSSLLQPLSGPSPFFVALRGHLFTFCPSWTSSSPYPTFGRSLSPFSGPSPFFVALRGPFALRGHLLPPSRPSMLGNPGRMRGIIGPTFVVSPNRRR